MKAVLLSTKNRHILNMHSGNKTNELRTRPPKIECPFKVYNFDTESSGGSGKVVSEWICDNMTTWRLCMGVPQHLVKSGCVSEYEILKYTDNGFKDLTAMHISDLKIYETPKELSEFFSVDNEAVKKCENRERIYNNPDFTNGAMLPGSYLCNDKVDWCVKCKRKPITRPPQSWCYVEELQG